MPPKTKGREDSRALALQSPVNLSLNPGLNPDRLLARRLFVLHRNLRQPAVAVRHSSPDDPEELFLQCLRDRTDLAVRDRDLVDRAYRGDLRRRSGEKDFV